MSRRARYATASRVASSARWRSSIQTRPGAGPETRAVERVGDGLEQPDPCPGSVRRDRRDARRRPDRRREVDKAAEIGPRGLIEGGQPARSVGRRRGRRGGVPRSGRRRSRPRRDSRVPRGRCRASSRTPAANTSARRVLPMPASPSSRTTRPSGSEARQADRSASSSCSRPTSGMATGPSVAARVGRLDAETGETSGGALRSSLSSRNGVVQLGRLAERRDAELAIEDRDELAVLPDRAGPIAGDGPAAR